MLSVYQHWDPLKVCLVGRSYPPEFYSFIKNPKVRSVMERIAIETEEDYQKLITTLGKFGVKTFRVDMSDDPDDYYNNHTQKYFPPPMCPRDHAGMFGDKFFISNFFIDPNDPSFLEHSYYRDLFYDILTKEKSVYDYYINEIKTEDNKRKALNHIEQILSDTLFQPPNSRIEFTNNVKVNHFKTIIDYVRSKENKVIRSGDLSTATTTRIGRDLYHCANINQHKDKFLGRRLKQILPDYRHHIIPSDLLIGGHTDATFCPIKPGLILTVDSNSEYNSTFPEWDVVELPGESWTKVGPFLSLKEKNGGKWWVPGEELNNDFTDFVESWLNHWVIYAEESVFDVNILVIDEENVICNGYNKIAFDAFERHGVTPHIVNFRHRYFWDGGLHCITLDIDREGEIHDYFPGRKDGIYTYLRKD